MKRVPGRPRLLSTRDGATVVVKGVPTRVCEECGEEYVDESAAARVLSMAEDAAKAGIRVEVREYEARPAGADG